MRKHIGSERRVNRRYPLELELSYRTLGSGPTVKGSGITHNISSRGLLFRADGRLHPDDDLELIIRWPALLNDTARLNLVIRGRVIRDDVNGYAMSICNHEFRTRGSAPLVRMAGMAERAMAVGSPLGLRF